MFYFRAKKGEYAHPKSVFSVNMGTGSCTISHFSQLLPFPVLMCGGFFVLFFSFVIVVFLFCSSNNVPELNYQQSFYFWFWFGFVFFDCFKQSSRSPEGYTTKTVLTQPGFLCVSIILLVHAHSSKNVELHSVVY